MCNAVSLSCQSLFALSSVTWCKDGVLSNAMIPWRRCSRRGLCAQMISEFLLGSVLRADSQTRTSSCVRSHPHHSRSVQHWFPLSPLDHTHAYGPPVCRSHWSPRSRLSAVVWFRLCDFISSSSSSRRTDTHQPCVLSCPDAECHRVCEEEKTENRLVDNASMLARTKSSDLTWVFVTASAPKPWLKKVRNLSPLTFHYLRLSREFQGLEWRAFYSLPSP